MRKRGVWFIGFRGKIELWDWKIVFFWLGFIFDLSSGIWKEVEKWKWWVWMFVNYCVIRVLCLIGKIGKNWKIFFFFIF